MSSLARCHANTTKHSGISPVQGGVLQRKCSACGNHNVAGGECEECKKKKPLGLQTKMAISEPGDPYEHEADRFADEVMAMPAHSTISRSPLNIQRFSSREAKQTNEVPDSVHRVLASSGRPLDQGLRQDMEQRFGYDFSNIRIHTDSLAGQSAQRINAKAYTVGHNIVFEAGRYAPGSNNGLRLVAHELTHVVQQNAARASNGRAGIAGAFPSPSVGRVALAPILQRDDGSGVKKEEVPIPRVPYREKAPSTTGETESEEGEAEKGPALALASVARPTCDPTGLARKDYLAQPNTSKEDFGLTRFAGMVSMALTTRKVKGGVMLEPLQVGLPAITSVYTKADTFIEGDGVVLSQEGAECPGGKVPLQWRIFVPGADRIRQGEMEHCEDLQYAYDVTFGWYGQVVDSLIAKGRKFASEVAAFKHLEKLTGTHPTNWPSVFECLVKKTEKRDGRKFTNAWHIPKVKPLPPRLDDGCRFSRVLLTGAANFPELGKHPTPDVIKGCGESPDAVKKLAAKASAGGIGHEGKSGEPTPKTPEPPPKSTEP